MHHCAAEQSPFLMPIPLETAPDSRQAWLHGTRLGCCSLRCASSSYSDVSPAAASADDCGLFRRCSTVLLRRCCVTLPQQSRITAAVPHHCSIGCKPAQLYTNEGMEMKRWRQIELDSSEILHPSLPPSLPTFHPPFYRPKARTVSESKPRRCI